MSKPLCERNVELFSYACPPAGRGGEAAVLSLA